MADYICFYLHSNKVNIEGSIYDRSYIALSLNSTNKLYFEKGAHIILYDWTEEKGYHFSASGTITRIFTETEGEKNFFSTIAIKVDKILKENNSLDDLAYSLRKVYRYKEPSLHFRRSYTYLEKIDYDTITNGRIFISRTAFGEIINSLPQTHIRKFISEIIITKGVSFFFVDRDYIGALKELQRYIKEEIVNYGEFLIASEDMLREHFSALMNVDDVGFLGEEDEKPDLLTKQAALFRELQIIESEYKLWETINREILESRDEEFFNINFTDKSWPINYAHN